MKPGTRKLWFEGDDGGAWGFGARPPLLWTVGFLVWILFAIGMIWWSVK